MAVHRLNHRLGNFYNLLLNWSALEKDSMKGFSKNLHSDKENDCLGLPSTHENLEDRSVTCQYMTLRGGKQLAPSHSSQASTWCTWGCSTIRSCSWTWRVQWRMRRNPIFIYLLKVSGTLSCFSKVIQCTKMDFWWFWCLAYKPEIDECKALNLYIYGKDAAGLQPTHHIKSKKKLRNHLASQKKNTKKNVRPC